MQAMPTANYNLTEKKRELIQIQLSSLTSCSWHVVLALTGTEIESRQSSQSMWKRQIFTRDHSQWLNAERKPVVKAQFI
jgi:hypothetical protein